MATKNDKAGAISADALAAARQKAKETRRQLEHKPGPSELLTPQEREDAAPFYFVLREYIRQLKAARVAAGVTLAELSTRTGLAVESLSRLETGAVTNPTWKTLALYAAALKLQPRLTAEAATHGGTGFATRETERVPPSEGAVFESKEASASATRRIPAGPFPLKKYDPVASVETVPLALLQEVAQ